MVARTEKILAAELHLYKLRPQAPLTFNRHHFSQVCRPALDQYLNPRGWMAVSNSIYINLALSGQCLSAVWHQQNQFYAEEAAFLSTYPSALLWLGSLHNHACSKYHHLFKAHKDLLWTTLDSVECWNKLMTFFLKVRSWMVDEGTNLGLQVVVRTLGGSQMDKKLIRFASGRHHHHSKQPMLVLFTDDGRYSNPLESKGEISTLMSVTPSDINIKWR